MPSINLRSIIKCLWLIHSLVVITGCKTFVPNLQVEKSLLLTDFPSGSSLEYFHERLYLGGDDATKLLILDTNYNRTDSITLFKSEQPRIPKNIKADLEASAIISFNNQPNLLLIGSASLPVREKVILIPLNDTPVLDVQSTTTFFNRLRNSGVKEINVEGATVAGKLLIMSNRGNLSNPVNHFFFTDLNFWLHQQAAAIDTAIIILPHTKAFAGISGLAYIEETDLLLFSASTELTGNSFDDGTIGSSYIGWIKNISRQTGKKKISADGFINLTNENKIFAKEKIESICVSHSQGNVHTIYLVSDNDNGTSRLFKVKLSIE